MRKLDSDCNIFSILAMLLCFMEGAYGVCYIQAGRFAFGHAFSDMVAYAGD